MANSALKVSVRFSALLILFTIFSCSSSEKLIQEESLTGLHEIRSSGFTAKTYSFSSCVISEVESSKDEVSETDGTLKTRELSFAMTDGNGSIWAAEGTAELRTLSQSSVSGSILNYSFKLREQASGNSLLIDLAYDPSDSDFNGFMSGTVSGADGENIYRLYSSRNLNFYDTPSEGLDGFTIRQNQAIQTTLIKTSGHWSVIYNFEEDYPEQNSIDAVVSALFIILERGRIK